MYLIKSVFDISKEIMKDSYWVKINNDKVIELADRMEKEGIKPFPPESSGKNIRLICWKELIASSINYCYWYGKSTIRPGIMKDIGASSSLMYKLVNECFGSSTSHSITEFKQLLAINRFPLLEERIKHISEIEKNGYWFTVSLAEDGAETNFFYSYFEALIKNFPGFASDIFLKRASLFFMQLYRTLGWFKDGMENLFIPADYQVPKMLKYFGCLEYLPPLERQIENNQLIQKHSDKEIEIRAATILVCKALQKQTGWNASEIDAWLWLRRKECTDPFHLTITTDY